MSDAISLKAQAAAVERAAVNIRGHFDNIKDLVQKGKRPAHELEMIRPQVPALAAAAVTLHKLARTQEPKPTAKALTAGLE